MSARAGIGVAMSAHDEEDVIREALESVAPFAAEIVVVDSGSMDRTAAIASEYARVIAEPNRLMLNVNKNVAIDALSTEWVLVLDPDERVSPELARELVDPAARRRPGYWIPRQTVELGRRLRPSPADDQLRLFRRGAARFPCRHIHEMVELDGEAGRLSGHLVHVPDQDLFSYVHKRNLYSEHRAAALYEEGARFRVRRLLLRPVLAFAKQYLRHGGWREGVPGLIIAVSGAYGTFLQDAKLWQRHRQGVRVEPAAGSAPGRPPVQRAAPEPAGSQVPPEHYGWSAYNDRRRWGSYWHQIAEVLRLNPRTCLIVGKGESTVEAALEHAGVEVTTCDIAPELGPDVVGDVRSLPFEDGSFDAVVCAQVLEHVEFERFADCLAELRRVSRGHVVLSLPNRGRSWEVALKLPFLPRLHRGGTLPARTRHRPEELDGQHHWELGARDYQRRLVEGAIRSVFDIEREYQVPDNPYHRFYILRALPAGVAVSPRA